MDALNPQPRFSIVIPVLNRADTLAATLRSCTSQLGDDIRIIVSDNLSEDGSRNIAEAFAREDARIEMVQPPRRLGQARHWEFALGQVKTGYFILLGADDALLPQSVSRVRELTALHPEIRAFHGVYPPMYTYPEVGNAHAGHLTLSLQPLTETRISEEWLKRLFEGQGSVLDLPFAYGMAWMDIAIMRRVEEKTGSMIPCRTPPVFLAVIAALSCETYLCVVPGFGCPAASANSIGVSVHSPSGDRQKDLQYFEETGIELKDVPFHPFIGSSRSEHMHVAETLLTMRDHGLLPSDVNISWDRLVANAHRELASGDWSPADRELNVTHLVKASQHLGCEHIMKLALEHPDLAEWQAALPFEQTRTYCPPPLLTLDLRPLGVRDVLGASQIAGLLLADLQPHTAPRMVSAASENPAYNTTTVEVLEGVSSMAKMVLGLQQELGKRTAESNRRAAERDRAKSQVQALRKEVSGLKASLGDQQRPPKGGWIKRVFRGGM
ncbi:glycosyltransferase family A protein [Verrucomicrobium sp. BvORR106]|uniref:glycosyltransferase family 2 protein n=1 Tax=Verrucomicrobium sp. BvORR106 TaxID=1403819 RepID=UPI00056FF87A|nr:glycosyltransferase family A protein [Verrucomicrobium sp. BvORR106]